MVGRNNYPIASDGLSPVVIELADRRHDAPSDSAGAHHALSLQRGGRSRTFREVKETPHDEPGAADGGR